MQNFKIIKEKLEKELTVSLTIPNPQKECLDILEGKKYLYKNANFILFYLKESTNYNIIFLGINYNSQSENNDEILDDNIQISENLFMIRKTISNNLSDEIIGNIIKSNELKIGALIFNPNLNFKGKAFYTAESLGNNGLSFLKPIIKLPDSEFEACSNCFIWYQKYDINFEIPDFDFQKYGINIKDFQELIGCIFISLPNYEGAIEFKDVDSNLVINFCFLNEDTKRNSHFNVLGINYINSSIDRIEYFPIIFNQKIPNTPFRIYFESNILPPIIRTSLFHQNQLVCIYEGAHIHSIGEISFGVITKEIKENKISIFFKENDDLGDLLPVIIRNKENAWLYSQDGDTKYKNLFDELFNLKNKTLGNRNYEIEIKKEVYLMLNIEGANKRVTPKKILFTIEENIIESKIFNIGNITTNQWNERLNKINKKLYEKKIQLPPGKIGENEFIKMIKDNIQDYLLIVDPYFDEQSLNLLKKLKLNIKIKIIGNKENPAVFRKTLNPKLEKFRQNLELLEYGYLNRAQTIHDRWMVSKNKSWFIGTSLNGIGKKRESHIIEVTGDYHQQLSQNFDTWWKECERLHQIIKYEVLEIIKWK